jgi:alpha-L-rhamnosidase
VAGDWLDPNAPPDEPFKAITDSGYVATCFVAHSARLLATTAGELGNAAAAERYAALGDRTAEAAWKKWHEHARTTQTGCSLAIEFDIAPATEHADLGETLAGLIRANDGKIGTGFLGTPFVLPALTNTGHIAEAYQLLLNEKCPGWLYEVKMGATTTGERWDAILPDGRINSGEIAAGESDTMSSFNHYANGAVASWLYSSVAGLAPAGPGYRRVRIAPQPGGGLTDASAAIDTEYGLASVRWSIDGSTMTVDVVHHRPVQGSRRPGGLVSEVAPNTLSSGATASGSAVRRSDQSVDHIPGGRRTDLEKSLFGGTNIRRLRLVATMPSPCAHP